MLSQRKQARHDAVVGGRIDKTLHDLRIDELHAYEASRSSSRIARRPATGRRYRSSHVMDCRLGCMFKNPQFPKQNRYALHVMVAWNVTAQTQIIPIIQ